MNRKKWPFLLLLATAFSCAFVCCKKPKKEEPPILNVAELLVGKKWQVVSEKPERDVDSDGDGNIDRDLHALAAECELDDYTVFQANGFVLKSDGNILCTETPPREIRWELTNNNSKIKITSPDEEYVLHIKSITDLVLTADRQYTIAGAPVNVTITFKKI